MPPRPNKKDPPDDRTPPPFHERLKHRAARAGIFNLREQWWRFLDRWETRRALRWSIYATLVVVVTLGCASFWAYPWWTKRNAIGMARQWIAAGRLDYATEAVQQAFKAAPERSEVWQLAAEVARRRKDKKLALEYSRHAASLAPADTTLVLEWAEDALLADSPAEAEHALTSLPKSFTDESARAQRAGGEIARRKLQLTAARDHFETALRLEGPTAINEVPLGIILLNSRDPAERQRAMALLSKWVSDREWGAGALRALLGDALARNDRTSLLQWAEALRVHPGCTIGDVPTCLLALSRADEASFARALAEMEKNHAAEAGNIALLAGWLNQIGRSADAVRWLRTLPTAMTQKPPVIAIAAEALRRESAWGELNDSVKNGTWGGDLEFLRLAYGTRAARGLGDAPRAQELWRTLQSDAEANGVHALFAAGTLYGWGWQDEAVTLWWMAVERPGLAVEALGNLARHYQTQHDAEGQYQVFKRLYSLRSEDPAIINNYVFFAALTTHDLVAVERLARGLHEREPGNLTYDATYAFVLCQQHRADEALALLRPLADDCRNSAALTFAYGFSLAATGAKNEARQLLNTLDPATLTTREKELIKTALD